MKTYLTLAFYFFTGSCLIFCILLPLSSSSPLEKGKPTITWQIGARDTAPVKRRILKRQTFVFDKDNAKSKQEDVALASVFAAAQGSGDVPTITTNGGSESSEQTSTSPGSTASDQTPTTAVTKDMSTTTTSAPTTVNSTTTEPAGTENVTTELPYTTNTENTTTSAATTISTENSTTSATTTVSTENSTTSATTTVSTENSTTSATTTVSTENSTTSATTTVSTENSTTSATTTISTENITTLPVTTSNENNTTSSIATRTSTTEAMATSSSVMTTTTKPEIANLEWIVVGSVAGGVSLIIICAVVGVVICCKCCKKEIGPGPDDEMIDLSEDDVVLQRDQYFEDVNVFLNQHNTEYVIINESLKQRELGSRMQKRWYSEVCEIEDHEKKKLLTVGPQSQGCPLKLHKEKHLKGLKKLLAELKKHPYLHPIEHVEVYVHKDEQLKDYRLLLMVQPFVHSGSLKDMIYKTRPLKSWANKYSQQSNGIPTEKVAPYGRQILEAMKFLYSQGFPKCVLGHVQTGNIFVVNDVCQLGGYENTLLGYKTRLFRLCKDDLQHFDIILFGHVIFEMAAGYELTQKQPSEEDYKVVDMDVRLVLEYIFEEGFPHDITEISNHKFFCDNVSVTELKDFPPSDYKLSDSMTTVLKKVCKKSGLTAEGDGHRGGWTLLKLSNPFKPKDEPKQDANKKKKGTTKDAKLRKNKEKYNVDNLKRPLLEDYSD